MQLWLSFALGTALGIVGGVGIIGSVLWIGSKIENAISDWKFRRRLKRDRAERAAREAARFVERDDVA